MKRFGLEGSLKQPQVVGLPDTGTSMYKSAALSEDRKHRYILKRIWDQALPRLVVIGLNPSTADETQDDPTIRKCIKFARREGLGGLLMLNLFSWRATDPKELKKFTYHDLRTPENNTRLRQICEEESQRGSVILGAWGNDGKLFGQGSYMKILLSHIPLKCLDHNASGHPKHPLYVRDDQQFQQWTPWRFGP